VEDSRWAKQGLCAKWALPLVSKINQAPQPQQQTLPRPPPQAFDQLSVAQLYAGETASLPSAATPAKKAKGAAAAEAPVKTGRATTGHAPFSLLPLADPDVTASPDVRPSVGAPLTMMGPAGASAPSAAQAAHARGVAARDAAVDALRSGCGALPASMQECHRAAEQATTVAAFVEQVAHQFTLDLDDQAAAILNFGKRHTADEFAKAAQTFGAATASRKRTAVMAKLPYIFVYKSKLVCNFC